MSASGQNDADILAGLMREQEALWKTVKEMQARLGQGDIVVNDETMQPPPQQEEYQQEENHAIPDNMTQEQAVKAMWRLCLYIDDCFYHEHDRLQFLSGKDYKYGEITAKIKGYIGDDGTDVLRNMRVVAHDARNKCDFKINRVPFNFYFYEDYMRMAVSCMYKNEAERTVPNQIVTLAACLRKCNNRRPHYDRR